MSFLSKLNIDGEEFIILNSEYEIKQGTNENGLPSSKSRGGIIKLTIEATNKIDFFDWSINNNAIKNGEIIYFKRDNISSFRTVEFSEAYCVNYKDIFDSENNKPLLTKLVLSAKEITMRGTTYNNNWPERNL